LYPQHLHQCDDQQSLQYDGKKILQKWTKGYIKPIARDDVPEPAVQHTDQPLTYKKNKKRKDDLGALGQYPIMSVDLCVKVSI
jgi:hypothetical protein